MELQITMIPPHGVHKETGEDPVPGEQQWFPQRINSLSVWSAVFHKELTEPDKVRGAPADVRSSSLHREREQKIVQFAEGRLHHNGRTEASGPFSRPSFLKPSFSSTEPMVHKGKNNEVLLGRMSTGCGDQARVEEQGWLGSETPSFPCFISPSFLSGWDHTLMTFVAFSFPSTRCVFLLQTH